VVGVFKLGNEPSTGEVRRSGSRVAVPSSRSAKVLPAPRAAAAPREMATAVAGDGWETF
jgi:hypothetical protein